MPEVNIQNPSKSEKPTNATIDSDQKLRVPIQIRPKLESKSPLWDSTKIGVDERGYEGKQKQINEQKQAGLGIWVGAN